MTFYSTIANNYKYIFPLNNMHVNFVQRHAPLHIHSNLLEIGSATGLLTQALKKAGYHTTGIELDNEMVNIAKEHNPDIEFLNENMLNIDKHFEAESQNVIVCFGNTIVHLASEDEISSFLLSTYKVLSAKGVLLVQFINYDYIIDHNVKNLPTIDNDYICFTRDYNNISETTISFDTTLLIKSTGKSIKNKQQLYLLRQNTFQMLAQNVGFKTEVFGDFSNKEWQTKSMFTIFKCWKA